VEGLIRDSLAPEIDQFVCCILRGENCSWPFGNDAMRAEAFSKRVAWHGTAAILYKSLSANPESIDSVPADIFDTWRRQVFIQAIWEGQHKEQVKKVLAGLEVAGCMPVLLKGSALAYDLYEEPYLRTRGDSDILVAENTAAIARSVLTSCGYRPGFGIEGDHVVSQKVFALAEEGVGSHSIDLHWKLNNSPALSRLFSHSELLRRSIPVPGLEGAVRQLCRADALIFACVHRFVHKQVPYFVNGQMYLSSERFIWLCDIHLLLANMVQEDVAQFLQIAREKGVLDVCRDGIVAARECFATQLPEKLDHALRQEIRPGPVSGYLHASRISRFVRDVLAVPGIAGKAGFLQEHIFPARDYMQDKYRGSAFTWLPWLYLRRLFGGLSSFLGGASRTGH